jgi:hypothetical protein
MALETSRPVVEPGRIAIPAVAVLMDVSEGQRPTIYARIARVSNEGAMYSEAMQRVQAIINRYTEMPAVKEWSGYPATEYVKKDIEMYLRDLIRRSHLMWSDLAKGWVWW